MKRALLSFCAVALLGATAGAESFKIGQFAYVTTGDNTVTLTKADSKDASGTAYTTAEVPEIVNYNGTDYTVTAIGEDAFKWADVVSVTLPNTIEEFGYGAFNGADKLVSINMPTSLKTIGDYALSSTAIPSINIPASVESIGASAFFTCKSLTSVTLNEGLKSIGVSAFYKVPVTEIQLPESLTDLGAKAFLNCDKLKTVTLPASLTGLGDGTFCGCTALTSVTLAAGITSIGAECFLKTGLETIDIPASVEKIGTSAFAQTNLTAINLDAGNKYFKLVDGVLYDAAERLLYAVPCKGVASKVTVSGKCIGINGGAFWGSQIQEVVLPDGLLAIDDYAFCQSSLSKINFPSSITYIGEQGFADTQLSEITLPANMPYIMDGVFAGCTKLTKVTIPSGVEMVFNHAFHNDVNVTSFTCLGATAPEIDDVYETYDSPFYGIASTTPLYIPKGSADSYKAAGWNSYFTLVEGENAVLALASADPASGTVLGKYADMKVELTFADDITVVIASPAVYLRKGSEISGSVIEPDDSWRATKSGAKTVNIWASDYDSMVQSFSPEQETGYYLVIPAGVVKNAAGDLNDRIVIKWEGPAAPKPLEVVSTSPADGSTLESSYADMKLLVTFADDITILDYAPDAELREDDPENGTIIAPDDTWKATKEDAKTVNFWAADYDACVQSFKVDPFKTYYLTIPAGVVQNAAGDKNEKIVITLKGKTTGIEGVEADSANGPVAHFDHLGRAISPDAKGLHIVKMNDGSVKKIMVK